MRARLCCSSNKNPRPCFFWTHRTPCVRSKMVCIINEDKRKPRPGIEANTRTINSSNQKANRFKVFRQQNSEQLKNHKDQEKRKNETFIWNGGFSKKGLGKSGWRWVKTPMNSLDYCFASFFGLNQSWLSGYRWDGQSLVQFPLVIYRRAKPFVRQTQIQDANLPEAVKSSGNGTWNPMAFWVGLMNERKTEGKKTIKIHEIML